MTPNRMNPIQVLLGMLEGTPILDRVFGMLVGIIAALALDTEKLVAATRNAIGQFADQIDESWVNRFSAALYYVATNFSMDDIKAAGGQINLAWNLMTQMPDAVSVTALVNRFRSAYGHYSPSQASVVTEEAMQLAARMLWADWMQTGEPDDQEAMYYDASVYLDAALDHYGLQIDKDTLRRDAQAWLEKAAPEELEHFDPELLHEIRNWDASEDGSETT